LSDPTSAEEEEEEEDENLMGSPSKQVGSFSYSFSSSF
jgi:hypothetical protein